MEESGNLTVDSYSDFEQLILENEEYSSEQLSALKEFYRDNREHNLREVIIDELEGSKGEGLKDIQLMSLLSSDNGEYGGERVEEDCDLGSPTYTV